MSLNILTIGVYGFDEASFFERLVTAKVDAFCDVRARRGMRGATYAFVNSTYLQAKLKTLGIRYFHFKALTPSQTTRDVQAKVDAKARVAKRKRDSLSDEFIAAYKADVLAHFDPVEFVKQFDDSVQTIVLFCVEREPSACHRSLLAQKLAEALQVEVQHLLP